METEAGAGDQDEGGMAGARPEAGERKRPVAEEVPFFDLLGLPVSPVDRHAALRILEGFVRAERPHLVVTADASGVVIAAEDAEFRRIWRGADLVTPDSTGI